MGNSLPTLNPLLERERSSWVNHRIIKRSEVSRLNDLQGEGEIMLCYQQNNMYDLPYKHYFLRTRPSELTIEFHGNDHFESCFEIHNKSLMGTYHIETFADGTNNTVLTPEILGRLRQVEGMCNYSLLLRNCEHVTKYVIYGKWFSLQVTKGSLGVFSKFSAVYGYPSRLINTPPEGLDTNVGIPELRIDLKDKWQFQARYDEPKTFYEDCSDPYNILLIGPTGSGKSNIINHIYRRNIAKSQMHAAGVTRAIEFYPGTYVGPKSKGNVCFIDTIGFCDCLMPQSDIFQMVNSVINTQEVPIHRVLIVFGTRVRDTEKDALIAYKKLLKFDHNPNLFALVLTWCDDLDDRERAEYIQSFVSLPEFKPFQAPAIEGVSRLTGSRTSMPRAVCTGLKNFTKLKPGDMEMINMERERLLGGILLFGSQKITFSSSCCTIL